MDDIENKLNESFDELLEKYEQELNNIKSDFKKVEKEAEISLLKEFRNEELKKEKDIKEKKHIPKNNKMGKWNIFKQKVISSFMYVNSKFIKINRKHYIIFSICLIILLFVIFLIMNYDLKNILKTLNIGK